MEMRRHILPLLQPTSLKFRIALIYAALLGTTLGCVVFVAGKGIDRYGEQASRTEMAVNIHVFDQILKIRIHRLKDSARVLAHDFGFRAAVATNDRPTITSALNSLASRAEAEYAFTIEMDGSSSGALRHHYPNADSLMAGIGNGARQGVIRVDGQLALAVAEPIKVPNLIGWLVLAHPLDGKEMANLAGLAPSRLMASVVSADRLPKDMVGQKLRTTQQIKRNGEAVLTWLAPLPTLEQGLEPRLILQRPLEAVLGNYATLKRLLGMIGLLGMLIVTLVSWRLASTITRPLRRLEEAVREFGKGMAVKVPVESFDEVGRLAATYNVMVDAIADREQKILDAMHDPLTLLPNRRLFLQRLEHELEHLGPDDVVALILADIDDFKNVNDTLGHPAGDTLLCEIGARLAVSFGDSQIARLGGDEFAIRITYKAADIDPTQLGETVVACFNREVLVGTDVVIPSGSVGIAIASGDGVDSVLLMKRADLALYAAKGAGKNCWHLFNSELDEASQRQRALELDLGRAIRNREFRFVFQPIYRLSDNSLTGYEALMRWRRDNGEEISPIVFIPAAEKTGLINMLGEWAIGEACRQAVTWDHDASVSVNVSPRQLMNPILFETVMDALVSSGLAPRRLIIEITESVFIENMSVALLTLRKLQTIGVRIALDDFGTGYSSLNFLRSFPFDRVKIDKCFVDNLAPDSSANVVIHAIITLADALNIETVAEGVETEVQLDILRREGCSQVQGYLLSRPVERDRIPHLGKRMRIAEKRTVIDFNSARTKTRSDSK